MSHKNCLGSGGSTNTLSMEKAEVYLTRKDFTSDGSTPGGDTTTDSYPSYAFYDHELV